MAVRQAGYPNSALVNVTDTVRMHVSETLVPNDEKASRAKWLTCQVTSLSGSSRMDNGVAGLTVEGGGGSTAGEIHRPQVAQQVLDGGNQGGSVEATTG
jgi:hypothetical protein